MKKISIFFLLMISFVGLSSIGVRADEKGNLTIRNDKITKDSDKVEQIYEENFLSENLSDLFSSSRTKSLDDRHNKEEKNLQNINQTLFVTGDKSQAFDPSHTTKSLFNTVTITPAAGMDIITGKDDHKGLIYFIVILVSVVVGLILGKFIMNFRMRKKHG